jgi:hypothetical protein
MQQSRRDGRRYVRWLFYGVVLALMLSAGAFVLALLAYLQQTPSCACVNGTQGPVGPAGADGADGVNASVTVTISDASNGTNVTEVVVYNNSVLQVYINITENATLVNTPGPPGPQGQPGANGSCTAPCVNGTTGPQGQPGANGTCTAPCVNGTIGPQGTAGANGTCAAPCVNGTNGANGVIGGAEFIRTTQSPNDSVPPGTAFTIDTSVYNSAPASIVASAGAGGTVFTLAAPGVYALDYEVSLTAAGSIALYKGATAGSLVIDNNSIAGSTTATSWIHGRSVQNVTAGTQVFALSSVVGTAAVTTAGTAAGFYVVRLTILQLI